jgi:hypothetical protein
MEKSETFREKCPYGSRPTYSAVTVLTGIGKGRKAEEQTKQKKKRLRT